MASNPTLLCGSCATHYSEARRESLSQSGGVTNFFSDNFSKRRGRSRLGKSSNRAFPEKGSAFPFNARGIAAYFGTILSNRPAGRPIPTKLPKSSQNGVERTPAGGLRPDHRRDRPGGTGIPPPSAGVKRNPIAASSGRISQTNGKQRTGRLKCVKSGNSQVAEPEPYFSSPVRGCMETLWR